jgi:glycosyltransferase 2 family protein
MTWPNIPKWLVPAVGYTISAASLVWVLSRFPYALLGEHLRTMDWTWAAVAVFFEVLIYFIDAWRWAVLLQPVGAPSFKLCLQAVFVGVFGNDVLPAKAGELVRCFLLSYETEVSLSLALTSDVILRVMDGAWMAIVYLVITLQIGTHVGVSRVMWAFSAGVAVISAVILYVLFHRQHAHHFVRNTKWAMRFIHLLDEIHRLGDWRELGAAMWISALYWMAQVVAIWALTRADKFDIGLSGAAFVLVVKAVGTLVPLAPANVGTFQTTIIYALGLLLVERPNAQIFAEIMFFFLTIPGAVGGAIALGFAGLDITDLHRRAHRVKELKNAHSE